MNDSSNSTAAPWLDALTELVARAKRDDPMAAVTVLVPTNIAGIIARRHLARGLSGDDNGIAAVWFSTPTRLAEQLAAPTLHAAGRKPATPPILAALTAKIVETEPGGFGEVAAHPATIQALVRAHRELGELNDAALAAVAAVSALSADVVRVHRALRDRLVGEWYETTDLLRTATDLIASGQTSTAHFGVLVDYLPGDRDRLEASFIDALAASQPLQTVASPSGFTALEPPQYTDRILTASDSDDEVRAIVREVVAALATTPAHRIAVFYTDRTPYARLLNEQLSAAGITVNGAGVRPVIERSVPRAVLGVLDAARGGWGRADLLRALGEAPVVDAEGSHLPRARWERLSREAGVIHGDDWSVRLPEFRDSQLTAVENATDDWRRDSLARTAATAESLRAFVAGLRSKVADIDAAASWQQCAERLAELAESLLPQRERRLMPLAEQYAAGALDRAISSLAALDSTETTPSLAAAHDSLVLTLDAVLPRVGRFGEGVYVGPLQEAAGVDLDLVFVVGLSEDIYPGRLHEDSLLPERVRSASLDQLRSLKESIHRKERDLVYAFAGARSVTASFARGDLRKQTARLPSRWLMPTLRDRAAEPHLAATDYQKVHGDWLTNIPSYAAGVGQTEQPATEQEWRIRAIRSGQRIDAEPLAAHQATLAGRSGAQFSAYDGNLAGAQGLPVYANSDRVLSATSLEKYVACPYAWFAERLLKVTPIDDPDDRLDIAALDIGNIIHESFDQWVRECADAAALPSYGEPWSPEQARRLRQIAREVTERYERAGRTGHPRRWEATRDRILDELDAMVERDNEWRAAHDARVVASELAFGSDGIPAVTIGTSIGDLRFRGAIDKVDEARDGRLHVTDIKTGSSSKFKDLSATNPVENGAKLQLPLYAHAARALMNRPHTPVEAHYWFVLRDDKRVQVPLNDAVAATYDRAISAVVSGIESGHYPQRAPESPDYAYIQCHYCNPDGLGHVEPRRRWEQIRDHEQLRELIRVIDPDVAARLDAPPSDGDGGE